MLENGKVRNSKTKDSEIIKEKCINLGPTTRLVRNNFCHQDKIRAKLELGLFAKKTSCPPRSISSDIGCQLDLCLHERPIEDLTVVQWWPLDGYV